MTRYQLLKLLLFGESDGMRIKPGKRLAILPEVVPTRGADDELDPMPRHTGRVWFVVGVFAIFCLFIMMRLMTYQVLGDKDAVQQSNAADATERGTIVDRDGEILAADRFYYEIVATPNQITSEEDRRLLADTLQLLAGIPAQDTIGLLIENAAYSYVQLASGLTQDVELNINAWRTAHPETAEEVPQFDIRPIPKRYYPQGELASHLIGFVTSNSERNAYYGVEHYYDRFLQVQSGIGLTERTSAKVDDLSADVSRFLPSIASKDLVLTIDRAVQWIIEDELRSGIEFYRARRGTIIVMEPKTGAILGMANWPAFNPNQYDNSNTELFRNPAISEQYEPGSIFKVITFAAGLDTNIIEPEMQFADTGQYNIGGRVIQNSNRGAAGYVSATQALARSINVVTAQIADQVGIKEFYRYVRRFGFGKATEIDLAHEVTGLLKAPGSDDWSISDLGTNSFGQGIAVTPIQMVSAVGAVANQGRLMRPYIVQERIYNGQVQTTKPTVVHNALSAESANTLTTMMVDVVNYGAQNAIVPNYTVAGKTGTAEIPDATGYSEDETIVSFVGFLPADDPQVVILIKMDRPDPAISQWAAYTAAPIFRRVAYRIVEQLNIPPNAAPEEENPNGETEQQADNQIDVQVDSEIDVEAGIEEIQVEAEPVAAVASNP